MVGIDLRKGLRIHFFVIFALNFLDDQLQLKILLFNEVEVLLLEESAVLTEGVKHERVVLVLELALVENTLALFWRFFGFAKGET